jgi:hypothetical protein
MSAPAMTAPATKPPTWSQFLDYSGDAALRVLAAWGAGVLGVTVLVPGALMVLFGVVGIGQAIVVALIMAALYAGVYFWAKSYTLAQWDTWKKSLSHFTPAIMDFGEDTATQLAQSICPTHMDSVLQNNVCPVPFVGAGVAQLAAQKVCDVAPQCQSVACQAYRAGTDVCTAYRTAQ